MTKRPNRNSSFNLLLVLSLVTAFDFYGAAFDFGGAAFAIDGGSPAGAENTIASGLGLGKVFGGMASWYGRKFHGKRTASGAAFNENEFTCAHRTLPFGTRLKVVNPDNGAECNVTVTDRGPFGGNRIIDLSKAAARKLGIVGLGRVVCSTGHHIAARINPSNGQNLESASNTGTVVTERTPDKANIHETSGSRHKKVASGIVGSSHNKRPREAAGNDDQAKFLNSPYYVVVGTD